VSREDQNAEASHYHEGGNNVGIANPAGRKTERIIIIGHGSPKPGANVIRDVGEQLHDSLHPNCTEACVKAAYLEFAQPDIMGAVETCVNEGATRIIVHPFFLAAGVHVTKDIPETLDAARARFPWVDITYTEPLGMHDKLIEIVRERIGKTDRLAPHAIEEASFDIIEDEMDLSAIHEEQRPIVKRVIHATADFEFARTLRFHPDAVRVGLEAIRSGRDILTDVEMLRAGINKSLLSFWGGKAICRIGEIERTSGASEVLTRTEQAIEKGLKENPNIGIVAIGNAPTALLRAIDIVNAMPGGQRPLVIGVPVGFVKAYESKALLANQKFPFITNLSRKGGSPVAAAIINALLKMAEKEK
jgi:precorrin-8X/cobalt-precorrin-8 methylmutase